MRTTGAKLWIPIHSELANVLGAHRGPRSGTILKTAYGKPFTAAGFGTGMADKIAAAGLPQRCVTHGLRKAAARRLAEAGCSAREIMAVRATLHWQRLSATRGPLSRSVSHERRTSASRCRIHERKAKPRKQVWEFDQIFR